ncbi:MAG: Holliday junction branch migration protein RuvA [Acidobacteria bacterium]|nr:Holliday junction branch migration protein RuvA [Thermoanaerobaculia bacterium]NLN11211.1 Holliday junction branch migration protein RuvA [Acidobacteriota bacterium]MBP7813529.1 Holliday junction branch migration protein RuvA [Thermoanaerobaculia bacterium]MBP8846302.1 Holliday junction branch migration protein RuvA [Thermoanaerobaculia bacterium]HPA96267.1 Holliday junction branch migration protein RuvA [Thermoanaerobaculia bacterium]
MIGSLRGLPAALAPERVLLDVGGVGYAVQIPLSTFFELERAPAGEPVRLFVHTHVREDQITLFGFWTEQELAIFERLIGVSGIGPRLAQVVLSGIPPAELVAALAAGDVRRLTTIPGVGRKTAERMIVELRDRMRELELTLPAPATPPAAGLDDDLLAALVHLGYKESAAQRAVTETRKELPEAPFPDLLRAALKRLARL